MTASMWRASVGLATAVALVVGTVTTAAADEGEAVRVIREPTHGQIVSTVARLVVVQLPPNPCRGLVIASAARDMPPTELPPNPCALGS